MARQELNETYRKNLYETITDPMLMKAMRIEVEGRTVEAEQLRQQVLLKVQDIKAQYPEDEAEIEDDTAIL